MFGKEKKSMADGGAGGEIRINKNCAKKQEIVQKNAEKGLQFQKRRVK